jgi:GAF domain-containing protein
VVASLSLALQVRGEPLGALNLYSLSAPFDHGNQRLARGFAEQASVIMWAALARAKTRRVN